MNGVKKSLNLKELNRNNTFISQQNSTKTTQVSTARQRRENIPVLKMPEKHFTNI